LSQVHMLAKKKGGKGGKGGKRRPTRESTADEPPLASSASELSERGGVPDVPFPMMVEPGSVPLTPLVDMTSSMQIDGPAPTFDGGSPIIDEPKMKLPSFTDFAREGTGAAARMEAAQTDKSASGFASKLPSINPGKPRLDEVEEKETPFVERVVFTITWVGLGLLVAIEIFINTPLFAQVKPAILNFLGSG